MDTKKLIGAMVAAFVILFADGWPRRGAPRVGLTRGSCFSLRFLLRAGGAEATRSTVWRILVLFKGAAVELLADPNLRTMQ